MKLNDTISTKTTGEILIIYAEDSTAKSLEKLSGVDVLIDPAHQQDFIRWLKATPINDAARQLGVSRAKAGRIRQAVGLSDEYEGTSRTTQWRRKKKKSDDDYSI